MTYAISQIIMRKIGDRESTLTVGLYTIVFAGILIAPGGWLVNQVIDVGPEMRHLRSDWPVPPLGHLPLLALLGLTGMVGYMLLSRAYQVASATLVAPFDYTYLPFATLLAYFLWNEVPTWSTLAGMVLIVSSGLYTGYRELLQDRPDDAPPPTADAAFAPGNPTRLSRWVRTKEPPDTRGILWLFGNREGQVGQRLSQIASFDAASFGDGSRRTTESSI